MNLKFLPAVLSFSLFAISCGSASSGSSDSSLDAQEAISTDAARLVYEENPSPESSRFFEIEAREYLNEAKFEPQKIRERGLQLEEDVSNIIRSFVDESTPYEDRIEATITALESPDLIAELGVYMTIKDSDYVLKNIATAADVKEFSKRTKNCL